MRATTQVEASAKNFKKEKKTQLTNYKSCKTKQKTKIRTKNNTKIKN